MADAMTVDRLLRFLADRGHDVDLASFVENDSAERALRDAKTQEETGSAAEGALDTILKNVELAREHSTPICQDTGTPIFEIHHPLGISTRKLAEQIRQAVAIATERC